ncbi:hypothetical protein NM688_g8523 [Phlebia brevispora]|uniref:Uncharacterized protein n=1 Tax=Phlebia brevispora TaxID=194682 RepID=A0ACC1RSD8_9APHY|nr:hypothetical protein NM688_g8523 [Phlebia brevispora]
MGRTPSVQSCHSAGNGKRTTQDKDDPRTISYKVVNSASNHAMATKPAIPYPADWTLSRLQSYLEPPDGRRTLRWESYLYGPFNSICTQIFLASQRFMVSPQLVVLDEHEGGDSSIIAEDGSFELEDDGANTADLSLDNFGAFVPGRALGRLPKDKIYVPDFVILKVPEDGDTRNDTAVGLIEIKKDAITDSGARVQMRGYMSCLDSKNVAPDFCGYLVLGQQTVVYDYHPSRRTPRRRREISTLDGLVEELRKLAEKNWH